jgi:hypothetical protein
MIDRVLATVRAFGFAAFFGGSAVVAFIMAPAAFSVLPTRELAGKMVGATLQRFEWLTFGAAGVALAASLVLRARRAASLVCDIGAILLLAGTTFLHFHVTPALEASRPKGTQPGTEFAGHHKVYTHVFSVEMLLAAAALVVSVQAPQSAKAKPK